MSRIDLPSGEDEPVWRVWRHRPEQGAAAVAMIQANWKHSSLPTRVREAARTRVAQLNGCQVCKSWRVEGFEGAGATPEFYDGIESWRSDPQYSARERAAIELAERFSLKWTDIDADYVAGLRRHFSDAEIVDLLICIGQYVAHGRLVNILDLDSACEIAPARTAVSR